LIILVNIFFLTGCNQDIEKNNKNNGNLFGLNGKVYVSRVVDGDTFVIEGNLKVRLIGVDTPESVKPNTPVQPFGKEASNYTRKMLERKKVRLEKDISDTDKYGRLLRYVYLEDGTFYNELLVKEGYARSKTYDPDIKFTDILSKAQKFAIKNNKGLWALSKKSENISGNTSSKDGNNNSAKLIKGNINSKGEKIYHLPGQQNYDITKAEELFKSEEEAINKGYRKSKR